VEEINYPHVIAIYAWGNAAKWKASKGWSRQKGQFVDGELKFSLRRPAIVIYRMQSDGSLDAIYEWIGGVARAKMIRVK